MPLTGTSDRPPGWWWTLTDSMRSTIWVRLRKMHRLDPSTAPDVTAWPIQLDAPGGTSGNAQARS